MRLKKADLPKANQAASGGPDVMPLFYRLFEAYGPQGWWPTVRDGYRPGDYHQPNSPRDRMDILCGAILTQNTSWKNVATVLRALYDAGLFMPERILAVNEADLAELIRPAGYFNQKAKKLIVLARAIVIGDWLERPPERQQLLELWGVGPETADSMLLYAWGQSTFVIDAYTRRLVGRMGFSALSYADYEVLRNFFSADCKATEDRNEYHALIVRHAKEHCGSKPTCPGCPLLNICKFGRDNI